VPFGVGWWWGARGCSKTEVSNCNNNVVLAEQCRGLWILAGTCLQEAIRGLLGLRAPEGERGAQAAQSPP
jgi:hypothetical protein